MSLNFCNRTIIRKFKSATNIGVPLKMSPFFAFCFDNLKNYGF